ncbi:MAG: hypothetical protein EP330_26650 [Deltaproteobacteria bacterium]|nr:MAG: hypothetical protein EP330_26650 [Deltaproteobacteria bacterium]
MPRKPLLALVLAVSLVPVGLWCASGAPTPQAPRAPAIVQLTVTPSTERTVSGASPAETEAFRETLGQRVAEAEFACGGRVAFGCDGDACAVVGPLEPAPVRWLRRPSVFLEQTLGAMVTSRDPGPCGQAQRAMPSGQVRQLATSHTCVVHDRVFAKPASREEAVARAEYADALCLAVFATAVR